MLSTVLTDVHGNALTYDEKSKNQIAMDTSHRHIHNGVHFVATDYATGITTRDYLVETPVGKVVPMFWDLISAGKVVMTVYRQPTAVATANPLAAVNSNHNSANVALTGISHTPTVTATGTDIIDRMLTGASPNGAGSLRSEDEQVLLPGAKYLFRLAGTTAPDALIRFLWYEVDYGI